MHFVDLFKLLFVPHCHRFGAQQVLNGTFASGALPEGMLCLSAAA